VIQSFRCKDTAKLFAGRSVAQFTNIRGAAERKLGMLHAATVLEDMRAPPGNRLERLAGDRAGQHSIRINDQWRVCFCWGESGPESVEIVDYH
jgi:toxin HigB-1